MPPSHRHAHQSYRGPAIEFVREWLGYAREGVSYLERRRWQYSSKVQSTLWNPPSWAKDQFKRKVRPRNYKKHPRTATELAGRDLFHGPNYLVLLTYERLAAAGLEGWDQGKEDSHDLDDWWFPSGGAFTGKEYRLPDKVLRLRWRMGCKREGKIIPFRANAGLGLFDRRGHSLPDYTFIDGKVVIIRNKEFIPFLCRYPLASIYLIGGEVNGMEGEIISWTRLWTAEHSRCLKNAKRSGSSRYTSHQHSSKPLTRLPNANSARAQTSSANRS